MGLALDILLLVGIVPVLVLVGWGPLEVGGGCAAEEQAWQTGR